jgi:hypothetical protein
VAAAAVAAVGEETAVVGEETVAVGEETVAVGEATAVAAAGAAIPLAVETTASAATLSARTSVLRNWARRRRRRPRSVLFPDSARREPARSRAAAIRVFSPAPSPTFWGAPRLLRGAMPVGAAAAAEVAAEVAAAVVEAAAGAVWPEI